MTRVLGAGPQPAKLLILGEAPGLEETIKLLPFIGAAGKELDLWLRAAGIARSDCYITNVFKTQPANNNLMNFCYRPMDAKPGYAPIAPGLYVRPEIAEPALAELAAEIEATKPSLVFALGNTALWATVGKTGITKLRGYITPTAFGPVLGTYHPSAVLRGANAGGNEDAETSGSFDYRAIALCDTLKARKFIDGTIKTKTRKILVPETIEELHSFDLSTDLLTFDIETKGQYGITCVGLAPNDELAYVVPFFSEKTGNYWMTEDAELAAWRWVKAALESTTPKLGQNGAYDLQWLARAGIRVRNYLHDTMLLHHALYPELPKSLLALGSIYCNEINWKSITKEEKDDT